MPQLKKVVLAMGNRLIYADTYEQALAQLSSGAQELIQQAHRRRTRAGGARRHCRGARARSGDRSRSCKPSASTCAATATSPARAAGPKPARNWRPSKRQRSSESTG